MAALQDTIKSDGLDTVYGPRSGPAFRVWGNDAWTYCRETFHMKFDRAMAEKEAASKDEQHHDFFIWRAAEQINQLISVVTEAEDRIGVPQEDRVKFYSANIPNVWCVSPGRWWIDPVRLTFLSAILKDVKENLAATLESKHYLGKTPVANQLFLSGHTFYQPGTFFGWCEDFYKKTPDEMTVLLGTEPSKEPSVLLKYYVGSNQNRRRFASDHRPKPPVPEKPESVLTGRLRELRLALGRCGIGLG